MSAPYAECDLDALIAIRDQLPPPPNVVNVLTAAGTVRARVYPELALTIPPFRNLTRGDS